MNLRSILPTLAVLATAAAAQVLPIQRVPVLSEPRSLTFRSLSYDAWGDTLIASYMGYSYRIVRNGDQVTKLDSIVSNLITSEMPRTLQTGKGTHLQVAYDRLISLDWTARTAQTSLPGVSLGYNRAMGDLFRLSSSDTLYGYLCSNKIAYIVKQVGADWTLVGSHSVTGDTVNVCSVDRGQGIRISYSTSGTGPSRLYRDRANASLSDIYDTLSLKPTSVFTAFDGAWLAYEDSTGTVRLSVSGQNRTFRPSELANLNDKYVRPVRKDSLMVFGGDSTLVLASWTRDTFQVFQTIKLDSRINHAMALGDSTLWVETSTGLLSFRVSWKDKPSTSVLPRKPTPSALRIHQTGHNVATIWNGSEGTPLRVTDLRGITVLQTHLQPGESTHLAIPPHSGMLFVQTSAGTSPIMVR